MIFFLFKFFLQFFIFFQQFLSKAWTHNWIFHWTIRFFNVTLLRGWWPFIELLYLFHHLNFLEISVRFLFWFYLREGSFKVAMALGDFVSYKSSSRYRYWTNNFRVALWRNKTIFISFYCLSIEIRTRNIFSEFLHMYLTTKLALIHRLEPLNVFQPVELCLVALHAPLMDIAAEQLMNTT